MGDSDDDFLDLGFGEDDTFLAEFQENEKKPKPSTSSTAGEFRIPRKNPTGMPTSNDLGNKQNVALKSKLNTYKPKPTKPHGIGNETNNSYKRKPIAFDKPSRTVISAPSIPYISRPNPQNNVDNKDLNIKRTIITGPSNIRINVESDRIYGGPKTQRMPIVYDKPSNPPKTLKARLALATSIPQRNPIIFAESLKSVRTQSSTWVSSQPSVATARTNLVAMAQSKPIPPLMNDISRPKIVDTNEKTKEILRRLAMNSQVDLKTKSNKKSRIDNIPSSRNKPQATEKTDESNEKAKSKAVPLAERDPRRNRANDQQKSVKPGARKPTLLEPFNCGFDFMNTAQSAPRAPPTPATIPITDKDIIAQLVLPSFASGKLACEDTFSYLLPNICRGFLHAKCGSENKLCYMAHDLPTPMEICRKLNTLTIDEVVEMYDVFLLRCPLLFTVFFNEFLNAFRHRKVEKINQMVNDCILRRHSFLLAALDIFMAIENGHYSRALLKLANAIEVFRAASNQFIIDLILSSRNDNFQAFVGFLVKISTAKDHGFTYKQIECLIRKFVDDANMLQLGNILKNVADAKMVSTLDKNLLKRFSDRVKEAKNANGEQTEDPDDLKQNEPQNSLIHYSNDENWIEQIVDEGNDQQAENGQEMGNDQRADNEENEQETGNGFETQNAENGLEAENEENGQEANNEGNYVHGQQEENSDFEMDDGSDLEFDF